MIYYIDVARGWRDITNPHPKNERDSSVDAVIDKRITGDGTNIENRLGVQRYVAQRWMDLLGLRGLRAGR